MRKSLTCLWTGLMLLALPALTGAAPPVFVDLSGEWKFCVDPNDLGLKKGWATEGFNDRSWRALTVPGEWEAQGVVQSYPGMPCPELSKALKEKGVLNAYNGLAWYRRWVEVPAAWQGKDLELLIGGVDDWDWAFFDGRVIGSTGQGARNPSSIPRRYTIPAAMVRPGRNLLAIRVYDGGGPGGIPHGPVVLLAKGVLEATAEKSGRKEMENRSLAEQFQSPPNDRRILKIIHGFPKDPKSHEALLLNLLLQGFGGVVCNVHFDQYLQSEEYWQSFLHGVRMAKKLGMALWLYDEQGYPSGTAGGLTLQGHPGWQAIGLLAVDAPMAKGPANLPLPEGPVVFARAYPVKGKALDLKAGVDVAGHVADGAVRWEVPDGQWRLIAFVQQPLFEGTHAAVNLYKKQPYINLLMPEPTAYYLKINHQAYADRLPNLKDFFEATFTDEPSLMSAFMRGGPGCPPLPWAPALAAEFRKRRGYDLLPLLPALVADVGPETGKVRCDFWQTVGELVAENFFGQIRDWCRAHGVPSGGHLLAEEDILAHCALYGDFFACVRNLDAPSIDCLSSLPPTAPWHIAKMIGSVASLGDHPLAMSETSDHSQQWRRPEDKREKYIVSEDEIRGTCNRLYVGGINTTTSYYRWTNISTAQLREINEYIGRCGVMLKGGKPVCDIAFYYPIETIWAHYVPSPQWTTNDPAARLTAKTFRDLSYALFGARRDFLYVDATALRGAKVADGALQMGGMTFRALVLPQVDTIPLDVWKTVAAFHAGGGVVMAVGTVPANSTSTFPCEEVVRLSREIFGESGVEPISIRPNDRGGVGVYVSQDYARWASKALDRVLDPDFAADSAKSPLRYTHRRTEGKDLYFVINDSPQAVSEKATVCAEGPCEVWDPATGGRASWTSGSSLSLGPYGGTFIVSAKCRAPKRLQPGGAGVTIKIEAAPIGGVIGAPLQFQPGAPGHVASTVTVLPEDAFRAESTIREGNRDCWSFPRATFPKPADLSRFAGLSFRSEVPEGQDGCGTALLVTLTEAGGATYLASTGRSLSAAGAQSSSAWFEDFHVLGKPDPNGRLDLGKIEAVAIGWGGYHARTGEKIAYTISDIKLLSAAGLE